jgi:hypothetical protein
MEVWARIFFRESAHIHDVHPFPHNCWITCFDKKRLAILAFPGHGYWTRPTVISPSFLTAAFVSCPFVIFMLDPKALGGDTTWNTCSAEQWMGGILWFASLPFYHCYFILYLISGYFCNQVSSGLHGYKQSILHFVVDKDCQAKDHTSDTQQANKQCSGTVHFWSLAVLHQKKNR